MSGSMLDRILAPGGIRCCTQPIVRVCDSGCAVASVECLSRGPRGTPFESPAVLFDYARRKVAECDVDRVAVATALASVQSLPKTLGIAVNVHASTLGRDPTFVDFLAGTACQYEIEYARLTVEVVEHSPVWNATEFVRSLQFMRELKISVALDDVGTGQSNYRMILDAAPNCFKIDSYLVQTAHADHRRRSMLASILQLARDLGSSVVAEGVENEADLKTVLDLGITLIQGYIFSRPLPVAELPAAIARINTLPTPAIQQTCSMLAERTHPGLSFGESSCAKCNLLSGGVRSTQPWVQSPAMKRLNSYLRIATPNRPGKTLT